MIFTSCSQNGLLNLSSSSAVALGAITTDEWPLLRDLPRAIKCKVLFANVMEYFVDGIEVPHAFIYTVEKKIYYMGKAPVFGIGKLLVK